MVIGADGRKRSHSFHRVLMRSAAKLNYAQAQAAIDGRPDDTTGPLLDPILKPLYAAYALVKLARDERDPLDLDMPERKILLKPDGTVDRVIVPERLDAHKLIEEFMILANVAAAEMLEKKALPLIYRVHDEPSQEKVHNLQEFLKTLDLPFAKAGALRPALFNRVLAQVKGRRLRAAGERSGVALAGAGRICRRELRPFRPQPAALCAFHFADQAIRRSDRASRVDPRAWALAKARCRTPRRWRRLSEVAAQISVTERRAMKAERETADRLIAHFLADRIGATFQGRISGVTRAGLFVKLSDTGADGLIPIRTLGTEYFNYDETRHALVGTRSGAMHRLGDVVDVRLVEAAPVAGALRFELLSEGNVAPRGRKQGGRRERHQSAGRSVEGASGPQPAQQEIASRAKASPANRRKASHGNGGTHRHDSLDPDPATARSATLDRDEARLSRPLPALRRRQAVSRVPEGRRPLLGLRTGLTRRTAPTICRPIS